MTTMTIFNEYNDNNEYNEEKFIAVIVGIVLIVGLVNSQMSGPARGIGTNQWSDTIYRGLVGGCVEAREATVFNVPMCCQVATGA